MDKNDKAHQLLRDIGEIDDRFIDEADCQVVQQQKKKISWTYFVGVAASIAAIALILRIDKSPDFIPSQEKESTTSSHTSTSDTTITSATTMYSNISEFYVTGSGSESVINSETTTETTPAVTDKPRYVINSRPIGTISGTGSKKAENYQPSPEYSYLNIDNSGYDYYTVEDSYYKIKFLSDKAFQDRINNDIKNAMDELSQWHDPVYELESYGTIYKNGWNGTITNSVANPDEMDLAKGMAIELICENGYLSIALGYIDSDGMKDPTGGGLPSYTKKERCFDIVATLNYDLIGQRKINNISELFYNGTDVVAKLNESVFNNYGCEINSITDYPDNFTIHYILHDNKGKYYHDYSTLMFFEGAEDCSIRDSLITSEYRDMSGVIDSRYNVYDEKLSFMKIPEVTTSTTTTEATEVTTVSEEITETTTDDGADITKSQSESENQSEPVVSEINTDIDSSEGTDGR